MSIPAHSAQSLLEKIQSLPLERILEVEDFVDFLKERTKSHTNTHQDVFDFPVDDLGPWPESLSLRREDMYGDNGR